MPAVNLPPLPDGPTALSIEEGPDGLSIEWRVRGGTMERCLRVGLVALLTAMAGKFAWDGLAGLPSAGWGFFLWWYAVFLALAGRGVLYLLHQASSSGEGRLLLNPSQLRCEPGRGRTVLFLRREELQQIARMQAKVFLYPRRNLSPNNLVHILLWPAVLLCPSSWGKPLPHTVSLFWDEDAEWVATVLKRWFSGDLFERAS